MKRFYWFNTLTGQSGSTGPLSPRDEKAIAADAQRWPRSIAWVFVPDGTEPPQWGGAR